jgi:putative endonuclease
LPRRAARSSQNPSLSMAKGYVFIMTNQNNTVLYTGMTGHLKDRVISLKTKKYSMSFTSRYNVDKLVWFEAFDTMEEVYQRERQIKNGSRQKKIDLITRMNPEWEDLSKTL